MEGILESDHFGNYCGSMQGEETRWRWAGSPLRPELGLTGKIWDDAVGAYYFNARWLDADRGRWLSKEPTGLDGPNLYHYVYSNPLHFFDPNGRETMRKKDPPFAEKIGKKLGIYAGGKKPYNSEESDYGTQAEFYALGGDGLAYIYAGYQIVSFRSLDFSLQRDAAWFGVGAGACVEGTQWVAHKIINANIPYISAWLNEFNHNHHWLFGTTGKFNFRDIGDAANAHFEGVNAFRENTSRGLGFALGNIGRSIIEWWNSW